MRESYFKSVFTGSKKERTAEGFLLCRDVRVARTGTMIYAKDELPHLEADNRGLLTISREDDVLFDKITLESGLGKSVTIAHPEEDVDPSNWKEYSIGTCLSCKRGTGYDSEYMLMDLMINDEYGIDQIEKGLVEISLGYDAKYHQDRSKPGYGKQTNILINHIALVESGRCGVECSIRDNKTVFNSKQGKKMPKYKMPRQMRQLFRDAFRTADAAEFEEIMDAAESEWEAGNKAEQEPKSPKSLSTDSIPTETDPNAAPVKDPQKGSDIPGDNQRARFDDEAIQQHVDQNAADHAEFRKRLEALENHTGVQHDPRAGSLDGGEELEKFIQDESPEEITPEEVKRTGDSRYLVDSLNNVIALAEIIAPGIAIPTVDASAAVAKTAHSICALRKKALRLAKTNDCAAIVDEINGGKPLDVQKMTCDAARQMFNAVALAKRNENKASSIKVRDHLEKPVQMVNRQPSLREINELNRQKWSK